MQTIDKIFLVHRAKSDLYSEYKPGLVAYVGNTTSDNGVMGYVTPLQGNRIFRSLSIVVSAFCDATIQAPPFIACGRAGNGLVVLEPRKEMPLEELAKYAAYINKAIKWRFNWYRQVTADRLKVIKVPSSIEADLIFSAAKHVPEYIPTKRQPWQLNTDAFTLDSIFDLVPGDYHSIGDLNPGQIPVISCGSEDNGLVGHFDIKKNLYKNKLTIALNGSPLATRYHPYTFAAKDDVAICIPKHAMSLHTLLFIQAVLEMERWRYSYYRKCYMNKLKRFEIRLPAVHGDLDHAVMSKVVEAAPYWKFLSSSKE